MTPSLMPNRQPIQQVPIELPVRHRTVHQLDKPPIVGSRRSIQRCFSRARPAAVRNISSKFSSKNHWQSRWFATPFPAHSFIHYSMPVYTSTRQTACTHKIVVISFVMLEF